MPPDVAAFAGIQLHTAMNDDLRATADARAATVISVTYIVGREATGMGAGPLALEQPAMQGVHVDEIRRLTLTAPVHKRGERLF